MKWFCSHDWSAWSFVLKAYNGKKYQTRHCKDCGLVRNASLGYIDGLSAEDINRANEQLLKRANP